MQYYLWWTVQGSRPVSGIALPGRGGILVGAVRHHDDHQPLNAGALDDYLAFSQHEIDDADLVGRPLDARSSAVRPARRPGASGARAVAEMQKAG